MNGHELEIEGHSLSVFLHRDAHRESDLEVVADRRGRAVEARDQREHEAEVTAEPILRGRPCDANADHRTGARAMTREPQRERRSEYA